MDSVFVPPVPIPSPSAPSHYYNPPPFRNTVRSVPLRPVEIHPLSCGRPAYPISYPHGPLPQSLLPQQAIAAVSSPQVSAQSPAMLQSSQSAHFAQPMLSPMPSIPKSRSAPSLTHGHMSDDASTLNHHPIRSPASSMFILAPPSSATFPTWGPLNDDAAPPSSASESCFFYRSPNPALRQRTAQACEHCRNRKTKCSGDRPACNRCSDRGLKCQYLPEGRARGPYKARSKIVDAVDNDPAVSPPPPAPPTSVDSSETQQAASMSYPLPYTLPLDINASHRGISYSPVSSAGPSAGHDEHAHWVPAGVAQYDHGTAVTGSGMSIAIDNYMITMGSYEYGSSNASTPLSATGSHFSLSSPPSDAGYAHINGAYTLEDYSGLPRVVSLAGGSPASGTQYLDTFVGGPYTKDGAYTALEDDLVAQFLDDSAFAAELESPA